ncbi:MAG: hypothetical protein RLZZ305_761 [Actinomycetota bacterium]
MDGYGPASYGDAFADVYDEWYGGLGDGDLVSLLCRTVQQAPVRVLELGVGTGRLLSGFVTARGHNDDVLLGVDTSAAMLSRARSVPGLAGASLELHDFSVSLPPGPFDLVFCGWNTFLNLPDDVAVCRAFANVARVLAPGGSFVVDASLPLDDGAGDDVSVRTITADRVVLSVSTHDPAARRIMGQFIEFANGAAPVLRPWSVRYVPVADLDRFAEVAGLALVSRAADGNGAPFTQESTRHVSVWRRT